MNQVQSIILPALINAGIPKVVALVIIAFI
jgi:hypothetical protein